MTEYQKKLNNWSSASACTTDEKLKSWPKNTWNFYEFADSPSIRGVNRISMLETI
jgi:hypothetical protein